MRWSRALRRKLRRLQHKLSTTPLGILDPRYLYPRRKFLNEIKQSTKTSESLKGTSKPAPKILFHSVRGSYNFSFEQTFQSIIARALMMRGANCISLTCSGGIPACFAMRMQFVEGLPCLRCYSSSKALREAFNVPQTPFRSYLSEEERRSAIEMINKLEFSDYQKFAYGGLPLGRIVSVSVKHILTRDEIPDEPLSRLIYKNFLQSGLIMTMAYSRALEQLKPDIVVAFDGVFFDESIMCEMARSKGIKTVTFMWKHHKQAREYVFFACGHAAGYYDIAKVYSRLVDRELTEEEEQQLREYLGARWTRKAEFSYMGEFTRDVDMIRRGLSIDKSKPIYVMFPNCEGDIATLNRGAAFDSYRDWLYGTIEFFRDRTDAWLLIRVHPDEVKVSRRGSRLQKHRANLNFTLESRYPVLPSNIKVIPPESDIDSYALAELADAVIVFSSTIGMELATTGVPIVVAGQVHYRGKGFTFDPRNEEEYFQILMNAIELRAEAEKRADLAKKYAYLFFLKTSVNIEHLLKERRKGIGPALQFKQLRDLEPLSHPYTDLICDFVLNSQEGDAVLRPD